MLANSCPTKVFQCPHIKNDLMLSQSQSKIKIQGIKINSHTLNKKNVYDFTYRLAHIFKLTHHLAYKRSKRSFKVFNWVKGMGMIISAY